MPANIIEVEEEVEAVAVGASAVKERVLRESGPVAPIDGGAVEQRSLWR